MCDVVEVLLLEQVDRSVDVHMHIVGFALVMGAKKVEFPERDEARALFMRSLAEPLQPRRFDPGQEALLRALGVHRGR